MTTTNKMQKTWLLAGAGMFAGTIALMVACTTTTVTNPPPDEDAGEEEQDSGSTTKDGSTTTDTGTTTDSGKDGGTCTPKPSPNDGPFCPFAFGKDSGAGPNCAKGETCCWGLGKAADAGGGFDPTSCVANSADCPAPSNPAKEKLMFECQETSDCATGVCCIVPDQDNKKPQLPASACATLITNAGTRCKASCGADDTQACQVDSECTGGKICRIGKAAFGNVYLGACVTP
ncbi:MAG: hypothetical protein U0174_06015 [Polyangiaceae bacterium]